MRKTDSWQDIADPNNPPPPTDEHAGLAEDAARDDAEEPAPGTGDMLKSVYDTDNDGKVENARMLDGNLPAAFATAGHDHNADYVALAGDQEIDGEKTFAEPIVAPEIRYSMTWEHPPGTPRAAVLRVYFENGAFNVERVSGDDPGWLVTVDGKVTAESLILSATIDDISSLTISDPPTQGEVETIRDAVISIRDALKG